MAVVRGLRETLSKEEEEEEEEGALLRAGLLQNMCQDIDFGLNRSEVGEN